MLFDTLFLLAGELQPGDELLVGARDPWPAIV
jgi:hypothetical protein